ncbi:MAG: pilus assembly protein PilM [Deltaproteobacteria bacterium]|nr:pilus assembly protein PilM [Deltaproteobacteria bacterium]
MAQTTIGLDLGSETIKQVRLRSTFRTVEVEGCSSVPVPQDDRPYAERAADALKILAEQSQTRQTDLLAAALPGDEVSLRSLSMPFSDNKRISQTIGFELEGQIPFSLDDIVFDYLPVHKGPSGSRLLLGLCRRNRLEHWLEILESNKMDPRLLGADCLAYASLAEHLPPPEEGMSAAVVDIGHRLTAVCSFGPGGLEFGRTLSSGGCDATAQLAKAFGVNLEKARQGKHKGAFVESEDLPAQSPEQTKISDALANWLDALVRELRQTLSTHRNLVQRPVGKIWLCGGGSNIDNLDAYLAEKLNLEVERLELEHFNLPGMEKLTCLVEAPNAWAKALGLALHAHQGGRQGWINLRRDDFAFKGDMSQWRGKILHIAVAFVILAILALGNGLVSYFSLRSTDKTLNKRIQEVTKAVLGKSYDNPDKAIAIIKEKVSPEGDTLPTHTALDVFRQIHELLPEDLQLRLKTINIAPTKIRVEGFADNFESITTIKTSLEKNKCFKEIQEGKSRRTREGEVEFELNIVNGC